MSWVLGNDDESKWSPHGGEEEELEKDFHGDVERARIVDNPNGDMNWLWSSATKPLDDYAEMSAENQAIPPPGRARTPGGKRRPLGDKNTAVPSYVREKEDNVCFRLYQQYPEQVEAYYREMGDGVDPYRPNDAPLAAAKRKLSFSTHGETLEEKCERLAEEKNMLAVENAKMQKELKQYKRGDVIFMTVEEDDDDDPDDLLEETPERASLEEAQASLVRSCKELALACDSSDEKRKYELECQGERWSKVVSEHPEAKAKAKSDLEQWTEAEIDRAIPCLRRIRSFVPLTTMSVTECADALGGRRDIAERILKRARALQLVRMSPSAIAKIHAADLFATYSTHSLGKTEARAVWLVAKDSPFSDDRKKDWLAQLVHKLKADLCGASLFDDEGFFGPWRELDDDIPFQSPQTDDSTVSETTTTKTTSPSLEDSDDDDDEDDDENLDRPAMLAAPSRGRDRFRRSMRSPSVPPGPKQHHRNSRRAASQPPRKSACQLKDEWWRNAVNADKVNSAVDRVKQASAIMHQSRKLSLTTTTTTQQPKAPKVHRQWADVHDFLRANNLSKFNGPLASRLYLTTDDLLALHDPEIDHITAAYPNTFSHDDVHRFKSALNRLRIHQQDFHQHPDDGRHFRDSL